ncbi:hypothetical protein ACFR97_10285 [Haloplanus litoreus]|uniref:Uncharacterized protein n=1 Tax=Haloplanus litoreus TaxID=767515 RepID=A0ABD6A2H4_9EURY
MSTDLKAYALALPAATQDQPTSDLTQNVETYGMLDGGSGGVESVSSDPNQRTFDGVYGGQYAAKMATELAELAQGVDLGGIPIHGRPGQTPFDGYYVVESADVDPADARTDNLWNYSLTLRRKGTKAEYRVAAKTDPKERPHPFGNDTTELVAIPATADAIRWVSRDKTQQQAVGGPTATVSAELGDLSQFDVTNAPYDRPYLVYRIAYGAESPVDCRVWDTRRLANKLDGDGDLQWAKVFATSHDPVGALVADNGRLRVTLDEGANTLSAERWDDANGQWTSVPLGSSDWQLFDVDLTHPGAAQVRARLTFEDTSSGDLFEVELALHRGWDDLLLYSPADLQVPSGLVTRLEPIAASTVIDPQPKRTLIARQELRE